MKKSSLLAVGPPPLTVEAADCSIDVIDFQAAEVRGVDLIDVTPAVRQAWRAHLATHYPMLSPEDRAWFANAPEMLKALQRSWPQWNEMQRDSLRQGWAAGLPVVLQFIEPALQAGQGTQNRYSAGAGASNYSYQQPNNYGYQQQRDASTSSLINQILAHQRQAEEEAMNNGGAELAQQVQMQNRANNIQMLSNISQMNFQSSMAIAKNIKW